MTIDYKLALRYGLISGAIMTLYGFITYIFSDWLFSGFWIQSVFGILTAALIVLLTVWFGITYRRNRPDGNISFGEAFVAVFVIFAVCMLMNFATTYLINNVIDTQYQTQLMEKIKKNVTEFMERMGAPDEEIDKRMEEFEEGPKDTDFVSLLVGYFKTLGFGAILSLIIALFVKRNSQKNQVSSAG